MRLTCPNCGAQYEVPDEVIPESGRDVQCSNCGDTWFQHHPDFTPAPDEDQPEETSWDTPPETAIEDAPNQGETLDEGEDAYDDTAADEETGDEDEPYLEDVADDDDEYAQDVSAPARRELDPAIASVLREEAERERAARAADEGLETQPELGLSEQDDQADKRSREAQARMARLRGEDPANSEDDDGPDPGARRSLLPDIDEINSSLSSDSASSTATDRTDLEDPGVAKSGGFRRGFRLVILLAIIGLLIYVFAPQIAQMVPALEGPLARFVEVVNALRGWLDGKVSMLMGTLDGMSSEGS